MKFKCAYTQLVETGKLRPHPSNRNKHSEKQIKALAKIIAKNGQRSPIVVSKLSGYIVKGHGRLEAIKLLGWENVAVDYQDYESDLEELNDRIADNEISRYAEFDQVGFIDDLKNFDLNLDDLDFEEFGIIDLKLSKEKKEKEFEEDSTEFIIVVDCKNELKQEELFKEFIERGLECKLMS